MGIEKDGRKNEAMTKIYQYSTISLPLFLNKKWTTVFSACVSDKRCHQRLTSLYIQILNPRWFCDTDLIAVIAGSIFLNVNGQAFCNSGSSLCFYSVPGQNTMEFTVTVKQTSQSQITWAAIGFGTSMNDGNSGRCLPRICSQSHYILISVNFFFG